MRLVIVLFVLFGLVGPAHATWLRSSSEHFVIYADDSEKDIRTFSEQLERYHAAMAFLTGRASPAPSPSNRVTIYVVNTARDVRNLYAGDNRYVQGFYVPRAGGSVAVVPRIRARRNEVNWSVIVLLHEYAHHFLATANQFPMPRWFSEGGAEFFASASFERDGGVGIGRPALHRGSELFFGVDVPVEELLDPELYEKRARKSYDAFYGKSWLLYHYLTFSEERKGQMDKYLKGMLSGQESREAAVLAFGDFEKLEDDLGDYMVRRKMTFYNIPASLLKVGEIVIRELSDGEAEMMDVRIRSKRGVTREVAQGLVGEAREIAARFPNDAAVLSALAEAEFDSGNLAQAIAAADAVLAIDPSQVNAYVQKGFALFEQAKQSPDPASAYREARTPFLALNRLENDHPLPLIYFYRSFVEQGEKPTKNAVEGLEWALELAPFDRGLRMMVARQQMSDRRNAQAHRTLIPIAYDPHGGQLADAAKTIIESLEGGSRGTEPVETRTAPASEPVAD